jgi:hypothetical protein
MAKFATTQPQRQAVACDIRCNIGVLLLGENFELIVLLCK